MTLKKSLSGEERWLYITTDPCKWPIFGKFPLVVVLHTYSYINTSKQQAFAYIIINLKVYRKIIELVPIYSEIPIKGLM